MGINKSISPSNLIGKVFVVGPETVPRSAYELEAERKDARERSQYIRRAKETHGLTWQERRSLEIERMKKRRDQKDAADQVS